MNFKSFYLTEASKEFNYIKFFVDKIEKVLKDFSKNRKRYEKYEYDDGYAIPLKDIISKKNFQTNGVMEKLKDVILILAYGSLLFSNKPVITIVIKQKDGSEKEFRVYGLYNKNNKTITIPFLDIESHEILDIDVSKIGSTIFHELTHGVQHIRGDKMKKTLGNSKSSWYKNKLEREAISNQLYKEIQKIIRIKIKNNKSDREEFNKTNIAEFIKQYVKVNNELVRMFEDGDEFEKWFNENGIWRIQNIDFTLWEKIDYLKKFYEEEWDDFVLNSYIELKKEFKNVIPTKVLRYEK